jgi:hypothetical protein
MRKLKRSGRLFRRYSEIEIGIREEVEWIIRQEKNGMPMKEIWRTIMKHPKGEAVMLAMHVYRYAEDSDGLLTVARDEACFMGREVEPNKHTGRRPK